MALSHTVLVGLTFFHWVIFVGAGNGSIDADIGAKTADLPLDSTLRICLAFLRVTTISVTRCNDANFGINIANLALYHTLIVGVARPQTTFFGSIDTKPSDKVAYLPLDDAILA